MKLTINRNVLVSLVVIVVVGAAVILRSEAPSSSVGSLSASEVKKYELESGEVQYIYSGMKEGTGAVIFDQWGLREKQHSIVTDETSGQTKETIMITDPENVVTIDNLAKTGLRIENRLLKSILAEPDGRSLTDIGIDIIKDLGGELVGTDNVAGYQCDMWEVPGLQLKQCLHEGVLLFMASEYGGVTFKMEAESAEFGQTIDPERFLPPSDVQVDDAKYPDEVGL